MAPPAKKDPKRRPLTPADRERGRRFERYLLPHLKRVGVETQEELGAKCGGISKAAVGQWYKAGKVSADNIHRLAGVIERPESEIWAALRGEKQSQEGRALRRNEEWDDVLGFAQAVGLGSGTEADEYAEIHKLKFKSSSLQKKRLNPTNLHVFYGKGDSMLPRIQPTDAILFDKSDTRVVDEKLYVIMWRGDYNVKRAEVIEDVVYFKSDNPAGDHNWRKAKRMDNERDPISVIGRVRWFGSWED